MATAMDVDPPTHAETSKVVATTGDKKPRFEVKKVGRSSESSDRWAEAISALASTRVSSVIPHCFPFPPSLTGYVVSDRVGKQCLGNR
jgi:hypothetical protein